MKRIRVMKNHYGRWVAGIVGHPIAASSHETWSDAMDAVPGYLAIAQVEQRAADALAAAFDRMFPPTEETP